MIPRSVWVTLMALPVLIACDTAWQSQASAAAQPPEVADTTPSAAGRGGRSDADLEVERVISASALFPTVRESDGFTILLHPPQIRAWPEFARLDAELALEIIGPGHEATRYGTVRLSGDTEVLLDDRIVRVTSPTVDAVEFIDPVPEEFRSAVLAVTTKDSIDVPLDLFLAYLAEDVLSDPPPPGFNLDAPPIRVRYEPTVLLFVNGEPVGEDVTGTALQRIVNANWPLFATTAETPAYYLLVRDRWVSTSRLDGKWSAVQTLPDAFDKLPDEPAFRDARATLPYRPPPGGPTAVLFVSEPAELIVLDGPAVRTAIEGTGGLDYVSNTDSLLFALDDTWYFLVAGRWFSTKLLNEGAWSIVPELPDAFSSIPPDHLRGEVRASVPGTMEARMAALEAMLPSKVTASVGAAPPIDVTYGGEPVFDPVPGTSVLRAINSPYEVIAHESRYYLLYSGVWYAAPSPTGAFRVTGVVPDAIYRIPPSSPSYAVTHVKVVQSTPTTIVYSYPPSYTTGVYVVYGVPYYGTGWYYAPYIWGRYYFPYYTAYGHGSWYNPATGGYGSRSVWAGPYGGYSYNQGYNPATGRYGYVETAWDGDEWASYGETYNPRSGVRTETSRYYDDDKQRSEMERTVERGSESIRTERTVDFEDQTSRTQRTTSAGGSSDIRARASDGTVTTSGEIRTGDGREFTIAGEGGRTGGTTGISGSTGSAVIDTKRRPDGASVSRIEGSAGGSGISASGQGPGRTTLGQSGSGDLYAGRNGNVYKKTDDGWQNYRNGGWQTVDVPGPQPSPTLGGGQAAQRGSFGSAQSMERTRPSSATRPYDYSRLDRDYGARQRGLQRFDQRSRMAASGRGGARSRR